MKLRLNGVEYDMEKAAKSITVWQYLELEDATGITVDALQEGKLSSARTLAAYAFLLRRHAGEDVSFRQAAEELTPEDFIVDDEPAEGEQDPTTAPTDSARGDEPVTPEG